MKIAVLSDIHDNIWNLNKALEKIKELSVEKVIFCGDMCSPFTSQILASSRLPTFAVFGNNDGDQVNLTKSTQGHIQYFSLTDEYGTLAEDRIKIAFVHYPKQALALAKSAEFQVVFYGHTHIKDLQTVSSVICNPGSICGVVAGKPAPASFAVLDTQTKQISFIDL